MIRLDYFAAIVPYVRLMTRGVGSIVIPSLSDVLATTQRTDAGSDSDKAKAKREIDALIRKVAKQFSGPATLSTLTSVAKQYGNRTAKFQKNQLAKQAKAVGIDLKQVAKTEKGVPRKVEGWIAINVDLIKSLPDRYFDDVRLHVYDAIEKGTRHETLAKHLEQRYEIPLNQANLIARDQIGKLYGQLNGIRQQNLGITGYIWRTANDNRVRPEHEDREGIKYKWDDPPSDGHPGEAIQCRCYPEPDFSDILS